MTKIYLSVPIPKFIESVFVCFLLAYRKKIYGYPFRKIKLTQGLYAIVDPEDFPILNQYKWFAKIDKQTYYAARIENGKKIYMHRQIMKPARGFVVDHKNHQGFDNRKDNLQIASAAQNNYNSRKTKRATSSIYKGVSKCKRTGRWRAVISANGIYYHLGYFDSEIEAAKAYDKAALELFGEFAVLNFTTEAQRI